MIRGLATVLGVVLLGVAALCLVATASPAQNFPITEQQKATKITNLLTKLRRRGVIVNRGTRTKPRWELSYAGDEDARVEPVRKKEADGESGTRGPGPA